MNVFGYDCLYYGEREGLLTERSLILFCIRPETLNKSNDVNKKCYGESIKFNELKLANVTAVNLFQWNAVIEIIDRYEKYLLLPNLINDNEEYCNCSLLSQFGKFCEYKFDNLDPYTDEQSFTNLLSYNGKDSRPTGEMNDEYVTCYIGIHCTNHFRCLDWRQICNGIVDCDHGEDEPFELCLQMESKECNTQTEYRCKNGLCIPKSFGIDVLIDCLDRSDVANKKAINLKDKSFYLCSENPIFKCDDITYGWKKFSCGDGQFISYSDLTLRTPEFGKTCENKRNFIYLKQLFSSNNKDQCWKSMICLTGFDYLYSNISCLNESIEININKYCSNDYYFPSNPVVYSFVYFFYEKINRTNYWFNYSGPNYICYKKEYCQKNISTIFKNNLTCIQVDQTLFSWANFYENIIYLFSSCYTKNIQTSVLTNHNKTLYKCKLSDTFISKYRVKDRRQDCFFNEDEDININLCSLKINNHFQCLTNENECIHQLLLFNGQYDCLDGSDEYFDHHSAVCGDDSCFFHYTRKKTFPEIYRFEELCDNIINRHLFSNESLETDETDCDYWPFKCYNSPYTKCNQVWNCEDGHDEIYCSSAPFYRPIRNSFNCTTTEHYCLQLINNNNDIKRNCIHRNRSGDGIIDCIGGTDERLTNICIKQYPIDYEKRFYCMNSSICIRPEQVCNRIIDCPFEDDERICPWLFKSNSSKFYCNNSLSYSIERCPRSLLINPKCSLAEHIWFCDLALESRRTSDTPPVLFHEYPKQDQTIKSISFESTNSNKLVLSKKRILSLFDNDNDMWLCKQGFPIRSLISNDKLYCLCSTSFYGNYCQHQAERVTVSLNIQTLYHFDPLTLFRLIIYLLNENHSIISYDELVHNYKAWETFHKFFIHLLNERTNNVSLYQRSKPKFVRIDSYIIKETSVKYISSWLYPILYPFLPVNKLVVILFLENELFKILGCKKRCGSNGECMYFVNSHDVEYCWCNQGWFGAQCHLKSSLDVCNKTSCSPHSQCVILNNENKQMKCICPLGISGNQCYIKYNSCLNVLCQNNGTCLPLDQRNFAYTCICQDDYRGMHCEESRPFSYLSIPANISYLSTLPAIIIMLGGQAKNNFQQVDRRMYKDLTLPSTLQFVGNRELGFAQIFHNKSKSFYYVIASRQHATARLNTTVISSNLCQNISEIFNETILYKYSYLKRLKLYHLPCQQNRNLRCFFDEYRMCLCTRQYNSDCFIFYHEYGNCDHCKNDGLCVRQSPTEEQWKYACLCSPCSFGSFCQFSTGNYFITLDTLLGVEIKSGNNSFNQQPFIIYFTLVILILILIFNLIFNTISIIIFSNKKLQQVGCDLYLLSLTIISTIGIILLFLRFIYMIIIQIYIIEDIPFIKISCILLEYLLRLIPSLFDWLTVCISIERAYTVFKYIHFTKNIALKTLKLSRWIIFLVLLLNIASTFHRPFHLILIDEPQINSYKQGHPWCVLDFGSTSWNIYEKIINIFHLVMPMILNILSVVYFLIRKIRFELKTAIRKGEKNLLLIMKEQLLKYKPLLISTTIIIILEIPRFILTFILACIQYNWQRYLYLTGFLISFLPLTGILFIYILPSPKYKTELQRIMKNKLHLLSSRIV